MRVVFLGAPGSGKGTQAKRLAQKFNLKHISTGDILRSAISERTSLGIKAKAYIDAGNLVPDDVMLGMIREELTRRRTGFIFDGFPRTRAQADGLDVILRELGMNLTKVFNLEIPDRVAIERLEARRVCRNCGQEYNLKTRAPKVDAKCDLCGVDLYRRPDDDAEVINKRLAVYHEKTGSVEDFYRSKGLLADIDGSGGFDDVFDSITEALAGAE